MAVTLTVAAALVSAPESSAKGPSATLARCTTGATAPARTMTVRTSMSAVRSTARMTVRFDLYARSLDGGASRRIVADGLGFDIAAPPGTRTYRYRKVIEQLPPGAAYRVRATFKWLRSDGTPQRSSRRVTGWCRQPDDRADLAVESVTPPRVAGAPYVVVVRNHGRSAAPSVPVELRINGVAVPRVQSGAMAAGQRITLDVPGPACTAGQEVRVTVDPDGTLDEPDEQDGEGFATCPA